MGREHIFVTANSGSMVIKMDLPVHDDIQHQLTKGELRRVNEDGTPWEPERVDEPQQDGGAELDAALQENADLSDELARLTKERDELASEVDQLKEQLAEVTKQRDEAIQDEEAAAAKPSATASKAKTAAK